MECSEEKPEEAMETAMGEEMAELDLKDVSDLPSAIIVINVPASVFTDDVDKENFVALFHDLDKDIRFEFFRSFKRVRMTFSSPQLACAARLYCSHLTFNGHNLKTFFAQTSELPKDQLREGDENGHHLKVPPPEKQFLISPPASPPVGWEQCHEMAPSVCSFDLMARLAAFAVTESEYEVIAGSDRYPAIVIHPCDKDEIVMPDTPYSGGSHKIPHTPRPPVPMST